MSNFVDDLTDLDYPKSSVRPVSDAAAGYTLRSGDWNRLCQAAVDLRGAVIDLRATSGVSDGDKGDIQVTSSGATWTIDTNVVGLSKLAQVATATFLGRATGGTGNVEALTGTQATALLDTVTTSAKGLVPTAPNDTTKFLRGDATWAAPSGGATAGSVTLSKSTANLTNVNLSTEGTVDWAFYDWSDASGDPHAVSGHQMHRKINGGRLAEGFRWVRGGGTATAATTAVTSDSTKFPGRSTTASDSIAQTSKSSDQTCMSLDSMSGSGYGCIWRIPLRPGESGTLKIYGLVQDHTCTFTAWCESNAAGVQTDSVAGASGNPGTPVTLTIGYTGHTYGDVLLVRFSGSATGGFNPHLFISGATMF